MIKAVIFDLYDTLIYLDIPVFNGGRKAFADLIERPLESVDRVWKDYRFKRFTGEISTLRGMIEVLLKELEVDSTKVDIDRLEQVEISGLVDSILYYDGVREMLAELRDKGYTLALLSNTSESSVHVVKKLPWLDLFHHVFLSHEIGYMKPDVEAFTYSLDKMNIAPHESIFIGDGGFNELDGARKAGILAVKVVQDGQHPSFTRSREYDHKIDSILDVPQLLETL